MVAISQIFLFCIIMVSRLYKFELTIIIMPATQSLSSLLDPFRPACLRFVFLNILVCALLNQRQTVNQTIAVVQYFFIVNILKL